MPGALFIERREARALTVIPFNLWSCFIIVAQFLRFVESRERCCDVIQDLGSIILTKLLRNLNRNFLPLDYNFNSGLSLKVDVVRFNSGEPTLPTREVSGTEVVEIRLNVPFFCGELLSHSSICKQQLRFFAHSLQAPDFVFCPPRYIIQDSSDVSIGHR